MVDEIVNAFIVLFCNKGDKKNTLSKLEKIQFAHCWAQLLPTFMTNSVCSDICKSCCETVSRGDHIMVYMSSILFSTAQAVYDFTHSHSDSQVTQPASLLTVTKRNLKIL